MSSSLMIRPNYSFETSKTGYTGPGSNSLASSSEIYGDKHTKRVREDFLPFPKSLYANSKIVGEELIKSYSKLYNIKFNILRFFNVCGKGQKEDFVITKFAKIIKAAPK